MQSFYHILELFIYMCIDVLIYIRFFIVVVVLNVKIIKLSLFARLLTRASIRRARLKFGENNTKTSTKQRKQ